MMLKKSSTHLDKSLPNFILIDKYAYKANNFTYDGKMNRIYEGINDHDGKLKQNKAERVKIKIIPRKKISQNIQQSFDTMQMAIFKKIAHPNILTFLSQFRRNGNMYLIFENYEFTLEDYVKKKFLSDDEIFYIWIQIVFACYYLNKKGYFHKNLKPSNIVMAQNGKWKLTGFQYASREQKRENYANKLEETEKYLSPQTLRDSIYNDKSEIWSIGLILYFVLTKKHLYETGKNSPKISTIYCKKFYQKCDKFNPYLRKLLSMCLRVNFKNRASFQQILKLLYHRSYIPKTFKKILNSKQQFLPESIIEGQNLEVELKIMKNIQKQIYFLYFLLRILKLFKIISMQEQFFILNKATEYYFRSRLKNVKTLINKSQKLINSVKCKQKIQELTETLKQLQEYYPNQFIVSDYYDLDQDVGVFQYLDSQGQITDIFVFRYQMLMRQFLQKYFKYFRSIKVEQCQSEEYTIYTVDLCLTLFQLQRDVIVSEPFAENLWDFIEVQEMRKLGQRPFKFEIDKIFTQLLKKIKCMGIFQNNL